MIAAAAERRGVSIDVDRVQRALAGTVTAFERRRQAVAPSARARRHRLRRIMAALLTAEDLLDGFGTMERDAAACRTDVQRARDRAQRLLVGAERPARPGPRRDAAVRGLILEVAWILHREGLPLSSYPEGLLAQAIRAVAAEAGRRLPEDRHLGRLLRPAVLFCRRHGGDRPSGGQNYAMAEPTTDAVPSPQKPATGSTH